VNVSYDSRERSWVLRSLRHQMIVVVHDSVGDHSPVGSAEAVED
jgi:hypothetical protein